MDSLRWEDEGIHLKGLFFILLEKRTREILARQEAGEGNADNFLIITVDGEFQIY